MKCTNTLFFFGVFFFLFSSCELKASPLQTTPHIKVDQFGYFPNARKVAVIADPQAGYNAAESYQPGTGANQYQVRRWDSDSVVFTGTLKPWNNGSTHVQSGDKGWWFDFSALAAPGSYYIFDLGTNKGSYRFDIGNGVYHEVLKQAMRTFYYQRINFAKAAPYADPRWSDGAWFEGPNQDRAATSRYAKGDPSTAKDLHGGWMDAGDLNKYTTFAGSAVIQLIEAYRINPGVFKDNYGIPESGNGIPDILDEVKWELDFLKRMQDATGTKGFFLKVGVDNYNEVTPPSTDTRPRYYLPECTGATVTGAAMFAVAAGPYLSLPACAAYGQDLLIRAEEAWARAKQTTAGFTVWQTDCDDGDIKSGDADKTAQEQLDMAFVAAVYLYEATGKTEYKTFAEQRYVNVKPYNISWWGPYNIPQQLALLRLTTLPGISSTVVSNIRNQKAGMEHLYSLPTYAAATDLYRAHLNDEAYHWGHNQARSDAGITNLDYITFGFNPSRHDQYREVAEQYLHWIHGVNPMGKVMLSNMYAFGAELCVNQLFHRWFRDGSIWDDALTSPNGPAPGYLPGGPNKRYSGTVAGISDQPHQKAYKDWNTDWPDNSWEISEPAIYYQAAYVMLLSRLMVADTASAMADTIPPTPPPGLAVENITATSLQLAWQPSSDNTGVSGYDVFQGNVRIAHNLSSTTLSVTNLNCATGYSFTVTAKDAAGNVSASGATASATTGACPVYASSPIYEDAPGTGWQDRSVASVRKFSNTSPVMAGINSIRVDYAANGTLAFGYAAAFSTSPATQLRFWVYNTGRNGVKVYTVSVDGSRSREFSLKPARSKWVEVVVDMAMLGSPATIKEVVIQNAAASATLMYFDQVYLASVSPTQAVRASRQGNYGESHSAFDVQVYPNPAASHINVRLSGVKHGNLVVSLVDPSGKSVYRQAMKIATTAGSLMIPVTGLARGIYYLKVEGEGESKTVQVVVQ